jgi:hypothetical protein
MLGKSILPDPRSGSEVVIHMRAPQPRQGAKTPVFSMAP